MPVFGSWVLPGSLESGLLLKEGVGDSQGMLCTELQQHSSVVVALANSMSSQNSWSYIKVPVHPCVEVTHDEDFFCTINIQGEGSQLSVKGFRGL